MSSVSIMRSARPNAVRAFAAAAAAAGSAQSGADVLCIKHGGGKRCTVAGCKKLVRKNNRCTKHAAEGSSAPLTPSPPAVVPASAAAKATKTKAAVAATAAALTATTGVAPVAPEPEPVRVAPAPGPVSRPRPLPPPRQEIPGSWCFSNERRRPKQREDLGSGGGGYDGGGGYAGGGGPVPSMSSVSQELPAPNFSSGAGVRFGDLSTVRPPVAAFGGGFAAGDSMRGMIGGGVPGNTATSSSNNGVLLHGDGTRHRSPPLPGIDSIGSALLRLDPRNGGRDGHALVGQPPPHPPPPPPPLSQIVASHLHSLGVGLLKDAPQPAGRGGTAASGSGRECFPEERTNPHQPEAVGLSPPQGLRGVHLSPPYLGDGSLSEGVASSSSLQPLLAAQFDQDPSPLQPSLSPAAAAAASSRGYSGGRRVEGWPGDADPGRIPAASCDGRGEIARDRLGSSSSDRLSSSPSRSEGEPPALAARRLSRPPTHAPVQSSSAAAAAAAAAAAGKDAGGGGSGWLGGLVAAAKAATSKINSKDDDPGTKSGQIGSAVSASGDFPINLECAICFNPLAVAALFACGHGSCWECAHDWCSRVSVPRKGV